MLEFNAEVMETAVGGTVIGLTSVFDVATAVFVTATSTAGWQPNNTALHRITHRQNQMPVIALNIE